MLPFLKKRLEASVVSPPEVIERKSDDPEESYEMLDAIAEDFLLAVEKKDAKLLKEALSALCEHIKDIDTTQDQEQV